jgi:hypothetical protein
MGMGTNVIRTYLVIFHHLGKPDSGQNRRLPTSIRNNTVFAPRMTMWPWDGGKYFFVVKPSFEVRKNSNPHTFFHWTICQEKSYVTGQSLASGYSKQRFTPQVTYSDMRVRSTKWFPLVSSSNIPQLNQLLLYSWVFRLGIPFRTYAHPMLAHPPHTKWKKPHPHIWTLGR